MLTIPFETTPEAPPTLWESVLAFLVVAGWKLAAVAGIVLGAVILAWILNRLIGRLVNRIVNGAKTKAQVTDTRALERSPLASVRVVQRTRTLGTILHNIVNITIIIISLVLIINTLAPDALGSLALLTAALGAGLGFGAQNIVKDVLNGIFIVAEDQVGIGDVVDLGLASGVVEYVSVRVTHVRDANGTLWYVRNGEITRIGNLSQGWARVILDLGIPHDADIDDVEALMLATAGELAQDPKWRSRIMESPEIWGLESIGGDALVTRVVIKTRVNARDDVAQELRRRLKFAFDGAGMSLPTMEAVTLSGLEGARRVRGANPPRTKPSPVAKPEARPVWRPKKPKSKGPADEGGQE